MKSKKIITGLLLFMMLMLALSGCGEKGKLMMNFKKGDSYNVEASINTKTTMNIMNQNVETNLIENVKYNYSITDVDKSNTYTIKCTIKSMNMKQTSAQGSVEYDSSKNAADSDAVSKMMSSMIGKSYTMKITSSGEVKEITGIDEMMNGIINSTELKDSDKTAAQNVFKQFLSDDVVKQQAEEMFKLYPNKKVNIGDKWNTSMNISAGIPMSINTTLQLKDEKDGVATINEDSKIKVDGDKATLDMEGMKFKYNISGKQNGTIKIKEDSGLITNQEITQKLTGTIGIDGNEQIGSQSFPVTIETTASYKMSK